MSFVKAMIPPSARAWLRRQRHAGEKKLLVLDRVTDWSVLRRVRPYRGEFGRRRGQCIDRFYIEKFLALHQEWIRGRVAEIGSSEYTVQFGGSKVERADVVDVNEQNDRRTLTLDLAKPDAVPEGLFDCIIATQVLLLIQDYEAAIRSLRKMLKEGGVALVTVPGISPIVAGNLVAGAGHDWWRFTSRSASFAFGAVFGQQRVQVETFGNVLTAIAFLHGLVSEELTQRELEHHDPDFEVLIGIVAAK
ncbi:MAG: methyltransferase domain-containing protein [Acidobacteriaceae bacterium]